MKTMKFLTYAIFVLFLGISITSCKGDDGADGIDGATGLTGADGIDGVDGNANVKTYIFESPSWTAPNFGDAAMSLNTDGMITDTNIQEDVILGYLKHNQNLAVFSIPGRVNTTSGYMDYSVFIFDSDSSVWANSYVIQSKDLDGNDTNVASLPIVNWVKLIVIESTGTTTTAGNGKTTNSQEGIYTELKNAGIDINDYYDVCNYYGLNPE